MFLGPFQESGAAGGAIEKTGIETYNSGMSFKTVITIIVLILLVLGVTKFLGYMGEKHDPSDFHLGEMVHTTNKVRQMKEDRSELIKKQESTLLDPE